MEHIKSSKANFNEKEYIRAVLKWLATLHASYWGDERVDTIVEESGLQQQGSYWYLDTRPDEHGSMPNHGWEGRLKRAARAIDNRLKRDSMQCLIHGDAKDANVMVTDDGDVVMCDFQYCGKGPPSKDLAYFFCSSVNAKDEGAALQFYLDELTKRLPPGAQAPTIAELIDSLELAYADFTRFMSGWGYWGGNMEGRVKRLLDRLDGGKDLGSEEAYEAAMHREFG
jgi:serine/threonine protein kinase